MSTFEGRMLEYTFISLDRFDRKNLSSTMFFLSHTHFDHTQGLGEPEFLKVLEKRQSTYLYCSKLVQTILLKMSCFKKLEPHIKVLEVNSPTVIEVPNDEHSSQSTCSTITVTLLQAGHCLGSVMFLIEGSEGTVLYTGDFRWEENEFFRMPWLKSGDNMKLIKSLYVDTTFCIPEAFHVPTRTQSYEAILSEVTKHFKKDDNNYVCIFSKTGFGYEHLLEKLAKAFRMKVHVDDFKKSVYDTIPKLKDSFTTSARSTRIHFHNTQYCPQLRTKISELLVIKVSVMWFVEGSRRKGCVDALQWVGQNTCRVCYSFHPSFEEVQALVRYLKPENVLPNVCPQCYTLEQTQIKLNKILDESKPKKQQQHCSSNDSQLGMMKLKKVPEISYPPRTSVSFGDSESSYNQESQISISESTSSNENENMSSSCDVQGVESDSVMLQSHGTPRDISEESTSHYTKLRDKFKDKISQHSNTYREMSSDMTSQSNNSKQVMSNNKLSQQYNSHEETLESVTSHHCNSQSHSLENMSQNSIPCEFMLPTMAAEQIRDISPKHVTELTHMSPKPVSSNQGNMSPKYTESNKDMLTMKSPRDKEDKEKLLSDAPLEQSEEEKYKTPEGNGNYVNYHQMSPNNIYTKNYTEQNEVKKITSQNQSKVLDQKEATDNQRDTKIYKDQLVNLSQIFRPLYYFGGNSSQTDPGSIQHIMKKSFDSKDSSKNIPETKLNVDDKSSDCISDGKSKAIALQDGPLSNNSHSSSFDHSVCKITEKSKRMSETSPSKNKSEIQSSASSGVTKSFSLAMNKEVTSMFSVDEDNNTINESLKSETSCSIPEVSAGGNNTGNICCMSKEIPSDKTVSQSIPASSQLGKRKHETIASCDDNCSNHKNVCDVQLVNNVESFISHSTVLENCTVEEKPVNQNSLKSKHRINLDSTTSAQSTSINTSQSNSNGEVLCKSREDNQPIEKSLSQTTIVISDSQNSEWDPDCENKNLSESQETMPPSPFSISSSSESLLSPKTLERMSSLHNNCDNNNLPVNCHDNVTSPHNSSSQDEVIIIEKKIPRFVID
ncbi:protein artemis [Octopus bimaculoides]|uniref:Protein artemis n=1 Tax=Octopus bimaculoides TaxID=37653 RepID=A0A0L8FIU8_OCTBM|nr:protein artemis [Octopus bimaculoides]|eukprot:XP_014789471.1 PREDICTED: protein artemis-like [Octopus bimaculoides]